MKIICLCGKIGVGKDFLAEKLKLYLSNTFIMNISDIAKYEIYNEIIIDIDKLYDNKTSETRLILQQYCDKKKLNNETYFIDKFKFFIELFNIRKYDYFIIADGRFPYEIKTLKKYYSDCLIVHIIAPSRNHLKLLKNSNNNNDIYNLIKNHNSETSLDTFSDFDFVFNNDINDDFNINFLNLLKKLILKN